MWECVCNFPNAAGISAHDRVGEQHVFSACLAGGQQLESSGTLQLNNALGDETLNHVRNFGCFDVWTPAPGIATSDADCDAYVGLDDLRINQQRRGDDLILILELVQITRRKHDRHFPKWRCKGTFALYGYGLNCRPI